MTTHKITVWPLGKVIEMNEGTSLLQALKAAGFQIKSSCGGVASCSDCVVKIQSGADNIEPPSFAELKLLGNVFHITKERLSCQTKVKGDITVDISSHDQTPGGDKSTPKPYIKKFSTKLKKKSEVTPPAPRGPTGPRRDGSKNPEDAAWYKHWDKDKGKNKDHQHPHPRHHQQKGHNNFKEGDQGKDGGQNHHDQEKKPMGGGRRPRPFRYSKDDE